jgi:hypothetical protein
MRMTDSIWRAIAQRAALGLALGAALIVGLAGCAGQAATPAGPATTAAPAPSPTATFAVLPDASSSYGAACMASQLKLSFAIDFSASTEMGTVTNASTSACSLFGFPGAELFDASQPIRLQVLQATSSPPWGGVFPEQRIQLAPGAAAYFAVKWSSATSGAASSCPTVAHFAMTPPNDTASVVANDPIHVCGDSITISPFQPAPFMAS